ncbi:hypothetical protein HYU22_02705 [Candidatus Woesearchaeota archaeon]|nr:hypothetical protein [Candidatus Woesearchaeota archaeon]
MVKAYHFRTEQATSDERWITDCFYVPGQAIFYFLNGDYTETRISRDDLRNLKKKLEESQRILGNESYRGEVEITGRTVLSAVAAKKRSETAGKDLETKAKELFGQRGLFHF